MNKFIFVLYIFLFCLIASCTEEEALAKKYFGYIERNNKGKIIELEKGSRELIDISFISSFEKLRILGTDSYIKDLSPLKDLTDMEILSFWKLDALDLSPLSNMQKLNYLQIVRSKITDLSPIGNLENLTYLSISSTELIDINPISKLTNLKMLGLQRCEKLSDITAVGELTSLEHLEITYSKELIDISPIGRLKNLKYLSLTGCDNVDPKYAYIFKDLTELKYYSGATDEFNEQVRKVRPDLIR